MHNKGKEVIAHGFSRAAKRTDAERIKKSKEIRVNLGESVSVTSASAPQVAFAGLSVIMST
jgi:hypothetical protein